jgi:hypothetical protein
LLICRFIISMTWVYASQSNKKCCWSPMFTSLVLHNRHVFFSHSFLGYFPLSMQSQIRQSNFLRQWTLEKPYFNLSKAQSIKMKNWGGSLDWICIFCNNCFFGSYTRVYQHFITILGNWGYAHVHFIKDLKWLGFTWLVKLARFSCVNTRILNFRVLPSKWNTCQVCWTYWWVL